MIALPNTPVKIYPLILPGGGVPFQNKDRAALTPEEIVRADRYRNPLDRDNFTTCRATLHRLLDDAPITLTESGKPISEGITFNVSHTKTHAVIAITRDPSVSQLGIDIEKIDPDFPHLQAARRHFPPGETALLESLPPTEIPTVFTRLWTAREAALKALGTGLQWDLDRIAIDLKAKTASTCDHKYDLHFPEIPGFPENHLVTIAVAVN